MKIQTVFKLSALAVALASTSAFAATINEGSQDKNIWTIDDVNNQITLNIVGQDNSTYQFADFGSGLTNKEITSGSETSRPVNVQHHIISEKDYYLVDGAAYQKDPTNNKVLIPDSTISLDQFTKNTFQRGGTSDNYVANGYKQDEEIKRVDSNNVTYGSVTVETNGAVTADVAVTTSQEQTEAFVIDLAGSTQSLESDKVVLGIVDKNNDKYGVYAQKEQNGKVTAESNLTASGISTTGYVKSNSVETTTLVADSITLAGKDLQVTLDGKASKVELNTLENKVDTEVERLDNNITVLDNKVTSEVSRLDQAILTTQETSRYYTDTKATETLTAAQDFAKTEDAKTLQAAKAEDVKVLASANAYTDAQIGAFGSTTARLNKRINDVEETAYRGIAIALAAQQQIPNIGAGQFAVFGGVGHYEGESAGALGLAGVLADGRTSLSAALGAAGNGEVGGRVGVAYVFGGK